MSEPFLLPLLPVSGPDADLALGENGRDNFIAARAGYASSVRVQRARSRGATCVCASRAGQLSANFGPLFSTWRYEYAGGA